MNKHSKAEQKNKRFGISKFILALVIVLVLSAIGYISYYAYALNHVAVVSTKVIEISDVTLEGFTLNTEIYLNNPSYIGFDISGGTYFIEFNGNVIEGEIPPTRLDSRGVTTVRISQKISWIMSYEIATRLLKLQSNMATIEGNVVIDGLIKKELHFETKVNMNPYIAEFATKKIVEAVNVVTDKVGSAVDSAINTGKNLINGIKSLFD